MSIKPKHVVLTVHSTDRRGVSHITTRWWSLWANRESTKDYHGDLGWHIAYWKRKRFTVTVKAKRKTKP